MGILSLRCEHPYEKKICNIYINFRTSTLEAMSLAFSVHTSINSVSCTEISTDMFLTYDFLK